MSTSGFPIVWLNTTVLLANVGLDLHVSILVQASVCNILSLGHMNVIFVT